MREYVIVNGDVERIGNRILRRKFDDFWRKILSVKRRLLSVSSIVLIIYNYDKKAYTIKRDGINVHKRKVADQENIDLFRKRIKIERKRKEFQI